jgi:hypothetical protein
MLSSDLFASALLAHASLVHSLRNADESGPGRDLQHVARVRTGGALNTAATVVVGLRHGEVGRKVSIFAAVMTGLIAVTQVLPATPSPNLTRFR